MEIETNFSQLIIKQKPKYVNCQTWQAAGKKAWEQTLLT